MKRGGFMARASLCSGCPNEKECKEAGAYCNAMNELFKIYDNSKKQVAKTFIRKYRKMLSIVDAEQSKEYEKTAGRVIDAIEELHFIKELDIKVGYVKSYEAKTNKGKEVLADCRKVKAIYQCFIPYDFIITVYEPNIEHLTSNQIKALLWHELCHIGINEQTLALTYRIIPHEIEEFYCIIDRLGTRWSFPGMDIEDITEGVS